MRPQKGQNPQVENHHTSCKRKFKAILSNLAISCLKIKLPKRKGWGGGTADKSTGSSSEGPRFDC